MGKVTTKFEDGVLKVSLDSNEDGQRSLYLEISPTEIGDEVLQAIKDHKASKQA